ncbi:MAG: DUF6463 family protein [SAR324 cluster bacterium]|nr:DUF6463 family protein [SAR324 cluster bacterium]
MIILGVSHVLLGVTPFAFGKQMALFAEVYFFQISQGLGEFPLLNGVMNYENFAAFWFVYFGMLMVPLGLLLDYLEGLNLTIPKGFIWSYLGVTLIGVYMIPFSGMTLLMLPHSLYMLKGKLSEPGL